MLAVGDAAGTECRLPSCSRTCRHASAARRVRHASPGALLGTLNRELVRVPISPTKFMGLVVRARRRAARRGSASPTPGITPPLVSARDGREEAIETGGAARACSADARYPDACDRPERRATSRSVHTDGLTEAAVRRRDCLRARAGCAQILTARARARGRPTSLGARSLRAAAAYADRPLDDLTVLVLKQLADPLTGRARARELPPHSGSSPRQARSTTTVRRQDSRLPARAANPRAAESERLTALTRGLDARARREPRAVGGGPWRIGSADADAPRSAVLVCAAETRPRAESPDGEPRGLCRSGVTGAPIRSRASAVTRSTTSFVGSAVHRAHERGPHDDRVRPRRAVRARSAALEMPNPTAIGSCVCSRSAAIRSSIRPDHRRAPPPVTPVRARQ